MAHNPTYGVLIHQNATRRNACNYYTTPDLRSQKHRKKKSSARKRPNTPCKQPTCNHPPHWRDRNIISPKSPPTNTDHYDKHNRPITVHHLCEIRTHRLPLLCNGMSVNPMEVISGHFLPCCHGHTPTQVKWPSNIKIIYGANNDNIAQ